MARFGDYETIREVAVRGLTSVYLAQRVAGDGPPTAVLKVLQLPESLSQALPTARPAAARAPAPHSRPDAGAWSAAEAAGQGQHAVFVSYSTRDKDLADAVCAALESAGIRCWMAPRDILPGASWASSILKAIAESRAMVLVFSMNANDSPHVRREVERAVHHGIPIAPIRVEDVMPKDDMEFFLSASHWMDALTPPFEQHLGLFAERVRQMLKQEGEADAAKDAGTVTASDPRAPHAEGPPTGVSTARAPVAAAPVVRAPTTAGAVATVGVSMAASSTARAAVAQFLDAARVQQHAAKTSAHWVPVYDVGEVPGGAYYAAARFGRTAEHLIESRARLTEENLHRLVNQTARALADLRETLDRPHGDLKPSNVLLKGDRLDEKAVVALADPLPTSQLSPAKDSAADLRSLGRLIVWLVAGRADDGKVEWPVPAGPAWAELGPGGDAWRELANVLLDPRPSADLWPEQVCGRVDGLCPLRRRKQQQQQRRRRRVPLAVGAAVMAAAAVGVPGWLYYSRVVLGRQGGVASTDGNPATRPAGNPPATAPTVVRPAPVSPTATPIRPTPLSTPIPPVQPPKVAPAPAEPLVERLWAAKNPAAPFKVTVVPQVVPSRDETFPYPCLVATVSSDRDCFIMFLARDPAGQISILIPKSDAGAEKAKSIHQCVWMGAGTIKLPPPVPPDSSAEEPAVFYVPPPYGRMEVKVIATARRVQTAEPKPDPSTRPAGDATPPTARGQLSTICIAGGWESASNIADLLDPQEWATAEADIVIQPPPAPASAGGDGSAAAAIGQGVRSPPGR